MCGRTVQTVQAVRMAASMLNVDLTTTPEAQHQLDESRDNYNLSPGMDAFVFTLGDGGGGGDDNNNNSRTGMLRLERKVWGLVTRGGTAEVPIESGMGKHFQNLMFNARADTLYERPTFLRLVNTKRSCLIAVDGFFEWKTETGGVKQPYFVSQKRKDDSPAPFMLLAGLWTSVVTGHLTEDGSAERLDTFTVITTDVCDSLRWLHSRMPLTVSDASWLSQCNRLPNESSSPLFRWHAVTPAMSSMKFRSEAAIQPLPKVKTVKSMFAAAAAKSSSKKNVSGTSLDGDSLKKRMLTQKSSTPSSQRKKSKKNTPNSSDEKATTIDSFFKPKRHNSSPRSS